MSLVTHHLEVQHLSNYHLLRHVTSQPLVTQGLHIPHSLVITHHSCFHHSEVTPPENLVMGRYSPQKSC